MDSNTETIIAPCLPSRFLKNMGRMTRIVPAETYRVRAVTSVSPNRKKIKDVKKRKIQNNN